IGRSGRAEDLHQRRRGGLTGTPQCGHLIWAQSLVIEGEIGDRAVEERGVAGVVGAGLMRLVRPVAAQEPGTDDLMRGRVGRDRLYHTSLADPDSVAVDVHRLRVT